MPSSKNKYDPDIHDEPVVCPRNKCAVRNAPQGSDEFRSDCWNCGTDLPVENPVSVGDELVLDIFDMHESGSGVGKTEDGFIVLVDGVLPDATARVRITQVNSSSARGKLLEKNPEGTDTDEAAEGESDEEDDDDDPALGSRSNYWG